MEAHRLRRAVLIAHYGCAYYLTRYGGDADNVLPTQLLDLRDAATTLARGIQPCRWRPIWRIPKRGTWSFLWCPKKVENPP